MALATYTDLQNSVANWLARAGDAVITTTAPDFITLCEARINYGSGDPLDQDQSFYTRPLRTRDMETSAELVITTAITGATVGGTANAITLTPTLAVTAYTNGLMYQFVAAAANTGSSGATLNVSGVGAVAIVKGSARAALGANDIVLGATYNVYYDGPNAVWVLLPDLAHCPLPPNYLADREFWYQQGSIRKGLHYLTPAQLSSINLSTFIGPPRGWTVIADAIRFAPDPDSTYYGQFDYYQKVPALAGGSNWLMTKVPNVYLYGALLEAAMFTDDNESADRWLRRFRSAVNGFQAQDERDRHSGNVMVISNDTGNP